MNALHFACEKLINNVSEWSNEHKNPTQGVGLVQSRHHYYLIQI
jgi:hypothetical protein